MPSQLGQISATRLTTTRGDTHTVNITAKKVDPTDATGLGLIPVDMTGGAGVLTVKRRSSDTTVLLSKAAVIGNPPGTDGVLVFTINPADYTLLPAGYYVYDIQVTTAAGAVYTLVKDNFEVREDVTP